MVSALTDFIAVEFLSIPPEKLTAASVAAAARQRALAAGSTITTHKEGRLVQERQVKGKLVELFSWPEPKGEDI
jgi:hypothetical protein